MFAGGLIAQLYRLQYPAIKINNFHYRAPVICKTIVCYRIETSDRVRCHNYGWQFIRNIL